MADIKEIAETLAGLSPQEVEILRHAQDHPDVPVIRERVSPPQTNMKWWRRFEKRKKQNK